MKTTTQEILSNYTQARQARNQHDRLHYEPGCPISETLQKDLNYWYKLLCEAERNSDITNKEIMQALSN